MKIGILFSSGLDSTMLVYKALKEGHKVQPLYIELKNNDIKTAAELWHIEKLISLFKEEFGYDNISDVHYPAKIELNGAGTINLVQPPLWVLGLAYSQEINVDEYQIGYVTGDCAISYLDDIKALYDSYKWFSREPLKKLRFPLIKHIKPDLINSLPGRYAEFVWTCEQPIEIPKLEENSPEYIKKIYADYKLNVNQISCGRCEICEKYKFLAKNDSWIRNKFKTSFLFYNEGISEIIDKENMRKSDEENMLTAGDVQQND